MSDRSLSEFVEPSLLPCPFCGQIEPWIIGRGHFPSANTSEVCTTWAVECLKCEARSAFYEKDIDAANAWNNRNTNE